MPTLSSCKRCRGFVPPGHATCLHCGARLERRWAAGRALLQLLLGLTGAGVASLTLMACYGMPPCEEPPPDGSDDPTHCYGPEPLPPVDAGADPDAGVDAGGR